MKTLQERLRYAREKKSLSQTEVGRRTGINNKTLSGYEHGVSEPDAMTLNKLATLYDVTTDWLITGKLADASTDRYKEFDPEVLEAFANASADVREHFQKYLRGEVDEPIFFTEEEKRFTKDLENGIEILDLFDRYAITIGGITPTREELEEVIKYFKAMRIMKMM